jgi:sugar lactone lactonase YvrE
MGGMRSPGQPVDASLVPSPELGRWSVGECPRWDPVLERLSWVDIEGGLVLAVSWPPAGEAPPRLLSVPAAVGFAVPADGGGLVVGIGGSIARCAPDGMIHPTPILDGHATGSRFNDGAVDPEGRLVVGTLDLAADGRRQRVVRLERDGTATLLDDDLGMANGIDWAPDGRTMYWVDSLAGVVWAADYGKTLGPRRLHARVDGGLPDGIAIDRRGGVWIAVWGSGEVRRLGDDGRVDVRIETPVATVTAVAFAGPGLDTLVATSSAMIAPGMTATPRDGMLMIGTPGDDRGVPPRRWQPAESV